VKFQRFRMLNDSWFPAILPLRQWFTIRPDFDRGAG